MTVHIGQITSEVMTAPAGDDTTAGSASSGGGGDEAPWAEQARLEMTLERLHRDRLRTATGHGDD